MVEEWSVKTLSIVVWRVVFDSPSNYVDIFQVSNINAHFLPSSSLCRTGAGALLRER